MTKGEFVGKLIVFVSNENMWEIDELVNKATGSYRNKEFLSPRMPMVDHCKLQEVTDTKNA